MSAGARPPASGTRSIHLVVARRQEDGPARENGLRVWDLPVRIVHWSLVIAVSVAVTTGLLGGPYMDLHGQAGLTMVGLLVFRLAWGLIGSTHARFASFLPTPSRLTAYLRGHWQGVGHNPLGALSVLALLGLLTLQSATGLFGTDEIAFNGPLFDLVSDTLALQLTGLHRQLSNVLLALLGLHVAAIAFYTFFKKADLVKPMLTGRKLGEGKATEKGGPIAFVVALAIALAAVFAISGAWRSAHGGVQTLASPQVDKTAPAFALQDLHSTQLRLPAQEMKGRVWLLNVWASWCASCRQEHAVLLALAQRKIAPIVGLVYMDARDHGARWLQQHGNPYAVSVLDAHGRVGADYGVVGVPEIYVIDKRGVIRLRHSGPVTTEVVERKLLPLIEALERS